MFCFYNRLLQTVLFKLKLGEYMKRIILLAMAYISLVFFAASLYAETAQEYTVRNEKVNLSNVKKYPSGAVQSGILSTDWFQRVTFAKVSFKGGTEIEFYESGQVKSGTLSEKSKLFYKGKSSWFSPGTKIFYSDKGKIESTIMAKHINPDQPLKPTTEEEFSLACMAGDLAKVKKETQNGKNSSLITGGLIAAVSSSSAKRLDVVKYLVSRGADVNYSSNNDQPLVFYIIPQHKPVPPKTKSKKDPLTGEDPAAQRKEIIASNTIAINMLKFLVSKKMSLDVKNRDGVTPVHYAIDAGCGLDMFKLLIKNGADYKSKSTFGQTPLERNKELGREDIYKYLSGLK